MNGFCAGNPAATSHRPASTQFSRGRTGARSSDRRFGHKGRPMSLMAELLTIPTLHKLYECTSLSCKHRAQGSMNHRSLSCVLQECCSTGFARLFPTADALEVHWEARWDLGHQLLADLINRYSIIFYDSIHPASRGGPPTPQVFWFSPCKDIEHASKKNCCVFWLFSFNTHVIYTFLGIKSVQNTGSYSVVSIFSSKTT